MNPIGHSEKSKSHRSRYRGFYTALAVSLAMIGAACWFAYKTTSDSLEENLSSVTEFAQLPSGSTTTPNSYAAAGVPATVTALFTAPVETVPTTVPIQEEASPVPESTEAETESATEAAEETIAHVLVRPLEGDILAPFSDGELVKSETTGTWQTHNGVDLLCETGTPVNAMDNGTVTQVVQDPIWGYCVTIDHGNNVESRSCGLDENVLVKEGDAVESGQQIGTTGNTADIESKLEPHLHFEVRQNGQYVDPIAYLES